MFFYLFQQFVWTETVRLKYFMQECLYVSHNRTICFYAETARIARIRSIVLWRAYLRHENTGTESCWQVDDFEKPLGFLWVFLVKRLLQLVRDHQQSQELDAKEGFYQQTLDPRRDCHLIRITLLSNTNIFPEVILSPW